jgi:hypothetical protein
MMILVQDVLTESRLVMMILPPNLHLMYLIYLHTTRAHLIHPSTMMALRSKTETNFNMQEYLNG